MRLVVQWATLTPSYVQVASADWLTLPKKREPDGTEVIDETPGWINAIIVHGLEFSGYDHYAVEDQPDGSVKVTVWNDDPADWPDNKFAQEWLFYPLIRDARIGLRWNTLQYCTRYAEAAADANAWRAANAVTNNGDPVTIRRWNQFAPPAEALARHGIWLTDTLYNQHRDVINQAPSRVTSWRSWTDGVDAEDVDENGELREGR